jgi:hypothetical protein
MKPQQQQQQQPLRPSVQVPAWILTIYLLYAQAIPAFHYEWGIRMGTQESAATVTAVGTSFWHGFCVADLLVYIPALLFGLCYYNNATQATSATAKVSLTVGLGITVYWPVVVLVAVRDADSAPGWNLTWQDTAPYFVVLPCVSLWALWGLSTLST